MPDAKEMKNTATMSHHQQRQFCEKIKNCMPEYFNNKDVLDVGSLNINGSTRDLFEKCTYLGIDICDGAGVDVAIDASDFPAPSESFDVVISTECLEHNKRWGPSLLRMLDVLKPGGLMVITCATTGRPEHGTKEKDPAASPMTHGYYGNLTQRDLDKYLVAKENFLHHEYSDNPGHHDLYFWGIKRRLSCLSEE